MVDFNETNETVERLEYYNGQFLEEKEFKEQQEYHRKMRFFHNKYLHTLGIVAGLEVSKNGNDGIAIAPGMAIDNEGREIILTTSHSISIKDSRSIKGEVAFVVIKYDEKGNRQDDKSGTQSDRILEKPFTAVQSDQPKENSEFIILSKIQVDENGKITGDLDNSVRTYSGPRIPDQLKASLVSAHVKDEAKHGDIIDAPKGTTVDDWDIFVALKEIQILGAGGGQGVINAYNLVINTNQSNNTQWTVICQQESISDHPNVISTGTVSYILLRKYRHLL